MMNMKNTLCINCLGSAIFYTYHNQGGIVVKKSSIAAVIITLIVSVLYTSQNAVYAAQDKARTITIHLT